MKKHIRMSWITPRMPIYFQERKFLETFHILATISQLCVRFYTTLETVCLYLIPVTENIPVLIVCHGKTPGA